MTTSGQAEEVPFLSGFERTEEPPKPGWQDVSVTVERIGRKVFAADGMLDALLGKVRTMLNMRGPDPDYPHGTDFERGFRAGAKNAGPSNFGGVGGDTKWTTWVIGIVGMLIAAGVLGLTSAMFTMTGRMASLETKVDMLIKENK